MPSLPPFCRGAQARLSGHRGLAPASPAAPLRRHAQSPWRLAPLLLLKMLVIFGQGQGELLGPGTPLPAATPPLGPSVLG